MIFIIITIISLWFSAIVITKAHKKNVFFNRLNTYQDRIVKLSLKWKRKNEVKEKYARIIEAIYDKEKLKITKFQVTVLYTPQDIENQQKLLDKDYNEKYKKYQEELKEYQDKKLNELTANSAAFHQNFSVAYDYNNQYLQQLAQQQINQQYYPQSPRRQTVNTEGEVYTILTKDCKLIHKNFDYISETVIKKLKDKKLEGGEKVKKSMPRLWKWLIIYLPLAILVWDIVLNLNNISIFVMQHFVLVHR